jgi:hypothetical protein
MVYAMMDGRARYSDDDALVISVCEHLEEALAEKDDYGDAVVVQCEVDADGALRFIRTLELIILFEGSAHHVS